MHPRRERVCFGFWVLCLLFHSCVPAKAPSCWIGSFLEDKPSAASIREFETDYGKRPAVVLVFLDWGRFPDEAVVRDIYGSGSVMMLTWEPWRAATKQGIDPDAVLEGKENAYLSAFAARLKAIGRPVLLRFAHEMNGDWYPWSAQKIGPEKYRQLFRYVRGVFDRVRASNVRWVFSINAEDVPSSNRYDASYPGEQFVDYIGLDGYNWGLTQPWSWWRSFREIFSGIGEEVFRQYRKPVIISEFGTTSSGGDKAAWIREALASIRKMPEVRGMVLFNVDKETDWRVVPGSAAGRELKKGFSDLYFRSDAERVLK